MQYFISDSPTISRALFNSIKAALSIVFWLTALLALVFFAGLYLDKTFAVDMLAFGTLPVAISALISGLVIISALIFTLHMGFSYKPRTLARQSLSAAAEIISKPYKSSYNSIKSLSGTKQATDRMVMRRAEVN